MENILGWIRDHQEMIYIVILMIFVGIEVIGRVPFTGWLLSGL
jgi:proton-translocating NAD(P)+ transhydrogenase subunit alpha